VFHIDINFHPSLLFTSKAGAHLTGVQNNGRLLALPTNVRLGWKCMTLANTQAYYLIARITDIKSFIAQHWILFYKTFYSCNCRPIAIINPHCSLIYAGKARAHFTGVQNNSRQLALPSNNGLVWKCMTVANTQAYYDTATITGVKSFIAGSWAMCYNFFYYCKIFHTAVS
jgi:hypothetical protein